MPYVTRQSMRKKYSIQPNYLGDFLTSWCCQPCFIAQNASALAKKAGGDAQVLPGHAFVQGPHGADSRRGQVQNMDMRGNARVVTAMVPLANMFGYVNTLRGMSQGRAAYSMQFDHYEQVPQNVADEVRAKMA